MKWIEAEIGQVPVRVRTYKKIHMLNCHHSSNTLKIVV